MECGRSGLSPYLAPVDITIVVGSLLFQARGRCETPMRGAVLDAYMADPPPCLEASFLLLLR